MPLIDPFKEDQPTGLVDPFKKEDIETRTKKFGGITQTPPWYVEAIRPTLQAAGLTAGGILGAATGPAAPAAVPIGAGLGYATAEKIADVTETALGYRKPESFLESTIETAKDIPIGAAMETGGQIAGKAIGWLGQKAIAPFATTISGETPLVSAAATPGNEAIRKFMARYGMPDTQTIMKPEVQELFRIYGAEGWTPLPSEIIPHSKTLNIFESVLGYGPVSGDVMLRKSVERLTQLNERAQTLAGKKGAERTLESVGRQIKNEAKDLLERHTTVKGNELNGMVDDFVNKFGISSKYRAGETFSDILSKDRTARQEATAEMYAKVKDMLPQQGKDTVLLSKDTQELAQRMLDEEMAKAPGTRNGRAMAILKEFVPKKIDFELPEGVTAVMLEKDPVLKQIVMEQAGIPTVPSMSWQGLDKTRSKLLELSREIHKAQGQGTQASGIYDTLSKSIDSDMASFAKKIGGDVYVAHAAAKQSSKNMHELYDKDILKIMGKNPEDVIKSVVNTGEVTLLKQVKEAVGDAGMVPLRQAFFKDLFDSSTVNGVLNSRKLQQRLAKVTTETADELLTPNQKALVGGIIERGKFFEARHNNMRTIDFLETLTGTSNERIVNAIVKPENVENIRLAKRLLSQGTIDDINTQILAKTVFKSSGEGNILPVSTGKEWNRYQAPLRELLTKEQFAAVSDFVKGGQNAKRVENLSRNASQTGQVYIGYETAKRLLTSPVYGVGTLGFGYVLAKIYTSPIALRYFTQAIKLPPALPKATEYFVKALSIVGQEEGNK